VSPSLDGVLNHDSLTYEGIKRPIQVRQILDSPSRHLDERGFNEEELLSLLSYVDDLYKIFSKKLSEFIMSGQYKPEEVLKLQAMFQEILKMRKIIVDNGLD
jgi:hypothetical protein